MHTAAKCGSPNTFGVSRRGALKGPRGFVRVEFLHARGPAWALVRSPESSVAVPPVRVRGRGGELAQEQCVAQRAHTEEASG
jgi:hypothetical protein